MRLDGDLAAALDSHVRLAFMAWEECHASIATLRPAYDAALRAFETNGGAEPLSQRRELRAMQLDCDRLFFRFLKAAEDRTKARYI